MDSFELNKIIGAVLGTCLILLVTSFTASALFAPKMPEKPGFAIAAKEAAGGGKEAAASPGGADREVVAARPRGKGRRRREGLPGLPHLREEWPEPRRS